MGVVADKGEARAREVACVVGCVDGNVVGDVYVYWGSAPVPIYALALHDALPICACLPGGAVPVLVARVLERDLHRGGVREARGGVGDGAAPGGREGGGVDIVAADD